MALVNVILDNRIHRTLRISTDANQINLAPQSDYVVQLRVVGGKDTLTISRAGYLVASIPCTNTYTPPASGTQIATISNDSCQFNMTIPDDQYRIVELQQSICDESQGYFTIQAYTSAAAPLMTTNLLMYENPAGSVIPMDSGLKVPPDLG